MGESVGVVSRDDGAPRLLEADGVAPRVDEIVEDEEAEVVDVAMERATLKREGLREALSGAGGAALDALTGARSRMVSRTPAVAVRGEVRGLVADCAGEATGGTAEGAGETSRSSAKRTPFLSFSPLVSVATDNGDVIDVEAAC